MDTLETIRGHVIQSQTPSWTALLDLAPDHIAEFMWMFEIELEDGERLHAYKHQWTRDCLHLSLDGRAFVYLSDDRYREVSPRRLLDRILCGA